MPIQPTLPRHTVVETDDMVAIILPSKKRILAILWMMVILVVWGMMTFGVGTLWSLFLRSSLGLIGVTPAEPDTYVAGLMGIALSCFLIPLLGFGFLAIRTLLWLITGKEIITANKDTMSITTKTLVFKRTREFQANEIRNLRVSSPRGNEFPLISSFRKLLGQDGMISFDYGAKTYRFGLDIEEAEARQIIDRLQKYLPEKKPGSLS